MICVASQVTKAMIKDGDSNTYLIGERYLNPDCYNTYTCCDNDQGWDQGFDWDTIRGTGYGYVYTNSNTGQPDGSLPPNTAGNTIPPAQDHPGYSTNGSCSWNFGSAHPAGFHMAFCDGSVKKIPFEINPTVHMQLGHRSDGQPTDGSWAGTPSNPDAVRGAQTATSDRPKNNFRTFARVASSRGRQETWNKRKTETGCG